MDEIFETGKDGKMTCKIDDEYEFTFHKTLREISNDIRKILDDWCKAYVTKEYQMGNDSDRYYRFDPVQDILIIISEKLEKIEKGLENL